MEFILEGTQEFLPIPQSFSLPCTTCTQLQESWIQTFLNCRMTIRSSSCYHKGDLRPYLTLQCSGNRGQKSPAKVPHQRSQWNSNLEGTLCSFLQLTPEVSLTGGDPLRGSTPDPLTTSLENNLLPSESSKGNKPSSQHLLLAIMTDLWQMPFNVLIRLWLYFFNQNLPSKRREKSGQQCSIILPSYLRFCLVPKNLLSLLPISVIPLQTKVVTVS